MACKNHPRFAPAEVDSFHHGRNLTRVMDMDDIRIHHDRREHPGRFPVEKSAERNSREIYGAFQP